MSRSILCTLFCSMAGMNHGKQICIGIARQMGYQSWLPHRSFGYNGTYLLVQNLSGVQESELKIWLISLGVHNFRRSIRTENIMNRSQLSRQLETNHSKVS
jgi:hypothetical protein